MTPHEQSRLRAVEILLATILKGVLERIPNDQPDLHDQASAAIEDWSNATMTPTGNRSPEDAAQEVVRLIGNRL